MLSDLLGNPDNLLTASVSLGVALGAGLTYVWHNQSRLPINAKSPWISRLPFNPVATRLVNNFGSFDAIVREYAEQNGPITYLNMLGADVIVVTDLDTIRKIMNQREIFHNTSSQRQAMMYTFGGFSTFASEGEEWNSRHRVLQPLHKLSYLKFHTETVHNTMSRTVDMISKIVGDNPSASLNFYPILQRAAIDVIGLTIFGRDLGVLNDNTEEFLQSPKEAKDFFILLDAITRRLLQPSFLWGIYYYMTGERNAAKRMKAFFDELFDDYQKKMDSGELSDQKSLLKVIFEFKKENPELGEKIYPRENILEDCFSFFGAGHETTTVTTNFFLYHLSQHPDVQEKIYQEFQDLLEDKKQKGEEGFTYEDVDRLHYLAWSIKESQRIQPSISLLTREVMKDTQINGINFPKGSWASLNTLGVQLSAKYYEDPLSFKPERWSHASPEMPHFPFGFGTRSCFGQKLALLEIKLFTALLLSKYRVQLDPKRPMEKVFAFGLVPKNQQCWFVLTPRK